MVGNIYQLYLLEIYKKVNENMCLEQSYKHEVLSTFPISKITISC